MDINAHHSYSKAGYDFIIHVDKHEFHRLEKHIFDLVAEKASNEIFEKHAEKIINSISAKSLAKIIYKKLEFKISVSLNKLLKLKD